MSRAALGTCGRDRLAGSSERLPWSSWPTQLFEPAIRLRSWDWETPGRRALSNSAWITNLLRGATRPRPRARRSTLGHRSAARRPRCRSSRVGRAHCVTGKELGTPRRRTTSISSPGKNTPRRVRRRRSTPVAIHREAPVDLECGRRLLAEDPSAWQTPPTVSRLGRAAVSCPTRGLPRNLSCQGFRQRDRDEHKTALILNCLAGLIDCEAGTGE